MLTLGIETSCDETAAAIVEDGVCVRSSVVASQHDLHAEYGGVVPEIASRAHVERIVPIVRLALDGARVSPGDIGSIGVGHRPGLIGPLLVGVSAAKSLAWTLGVPLIGVDHVHAHLYAGLLGADRPAFPAIGLVVSGGHSSIYRMDSPTTLARLGATIDDAVGEAFDKAATVLGLEHPGGPNLERLAKGGDPEAHKLPISRLGKDSLDFSFSGLKTAMLYAVRGRPDAGGNFPRTHADLSEQAKRDLAASFQHACVSAIMLKLGRASDANPDCRTLLTGGGVTANTTLRDALRAFADERGLDLRLPEMRFCVDNGAMIAGLAHERLRAGLQDDLTLAPVPTTAC